MSLSSTTSRVQYAGNHSTETPYAIPFVFLEDTDLQVFVDDAPAPLTLISDYTVTGAGQTGGGAVLTSVAYGSGQRITIVRTVPATQEAVFVEDGKFPSRSFETALDRSAMLAQQTLRNTERSIRASEASQPLTGTFVARPDVVVTLGHDGQPATRDATELFSFLGINPTFVANIAEYVNVIDHGARGDGTTDDYPAILAALTAARTGPGRTLYFPGNRTYRIGTAGVHGIHLAQDSDFQILGEPGAELLIDNLVSGLAVGHGILVEGPCANVTIRGLKVRYATFPTARQTYAPIFFIGANTGGPTIWYRGAAGDERPDLLAAGACRNIQVIDCATENSPSVMLGLAGIDGGCVRNFRGHQSWADGVYLLYFRNVIQEGSRLTQVGDDAFSFSSYETSLTDADLDHPFHGEGSVCGNCFADGFFPTPTASASGGVALLGVRDLAIGNITVRNKFRGVRVECGTAVSTADPFLSTLASRGVVVSGVSVENSFHAISCVNKEVDYSADPKWWRNRVLISGLVSTNNSDTPFTANYPINSYGDAQDSGRTIPAIMCGFELSGCQFHDSTAGGLGGFSECRFVDLSIPDAPWGFSGYTPYRGDLANAAYRENQSDFIDVRGRDLSFTSLKKCWLDGVKSEGAGAVGIGIYGCADLTFGTLVVKNTNRDDASFPGGVVIDDLSQHVCGEAVVFEQDTVAVPNGVSITGAAFHRIERVVIKTALNTFYQMVFDQAFTTTGLSQIGQISWYHSANSAPKWTHLAFAPNQIGVAGDTNFDIYPASAPRVFRINFPLTANRTGTLHEDGAPTGTQMEILRTAASTGAFAFTILGQGQGTPEVIANPSRGTFLLTGGSYVPGVNTIQQILVNGVNILPAPMDWGTANFFERNNEFMAAKIAGEIHALAGTYDAESSSNLIWITAPAGASYNGQVITFVTTGDVVFSDVRALSGGLDHAAAGATPAPYSLATLSAARTGLRLIKTATTWEVLSTTGY